jgi:hypothetical protein
VIKASDDTTVITRMRQLLCLWLAEVGGMIPQLLFPRSLMPESLISSDWLVIVS